MPSAPKPTVGRIVHYTSLGDRDGKYPSELHAAIITKVVDADEGHVSLHVYYPTGAFNMPEVLHTTEPAGSEAARGKWSWPARVDDRTIIHSVEALREEQPVTDSSNSPPEDGLVATLTKLGPMGLIEIITHRWREEPWLKSPTFVAQFLRELASHPPTVRPSDRAFADRSFEALLIELGPHYLLTIITARWLHDGLSKDSVAAFLGHLASRISPEGAPDAEDVGSEGSDTTPSKPPRNGSVPGLDTILAGVTPMGLIEVITARWLCGIPRAFVDSPAAEAVAQSLTDLASRIPQGAEAGDGETAASRPEAEADVHDIRRAINVLFDNRRARPIAETSRDLMDIAVLVADRVAQAELERSNA